MSKRKAGKAKGRPKESPDDGPFVPIRHYYHSHNFLKIKDKEWEHSSDSDDEEQSWDRAVAESEINDFTDLSEGEKQLLILWNNYIKSDTKIANKKIPQHCVNFIKSHAKTIRDRGIDEQLQWHLVTLWDEGLISSDHLSSCLDYYYSLVGPPHEPKMGSTSSQAIVLDDD
ncbi:Polycomb protein SUZ12 [Seminavis robusta]|uniref:Polycomb protein SUZ12 n=1 Tax=Seminavis robusta TaxID=568900 RepID=A0A9N8I0K2_9STRA|nr:Polycomb protein SUZ12 [Seminavis robusta]|eukprot:Sro2742_g336040.1 Polycomb protein SUZ12 (171) ;mRNA; f:9677-10305